MSEQQLMGTGRFLGNEVMDVEEESEALRCINRLEMYQAAMFAMMHRWGADKDTGALVRGSWLHGPWRVTRSSFCS